MESEYDVLLPYIPAENVEVTNYGSSTSGQEEGDTMGKLTTIQSEGRKLPQYIAALAATLGALAAGAVLGFTSPTGQELQDGDLGFKISSSEFSWVGSLAPLGCMLMCIPIGSILDFMGRKTTMLSVIIVFTVGWALIIWAQGLAMLLVGRFLTGMAGGTFCVAAPLYTSEIAQKEIRGSLGSYFQLMITIGILFVYVLGNYCRPQTVAIVCGIIPFVFGLAFAFMPESPMFELKKGRRAKAEANLQWLRGKEYDIQSEVKEMMDVLDDDKKNPISFRESIKKKVTKKAFMISFGLMLFQQLSGVNAVIFYTSRIFKDAGVDIPPKEASIIVGSMQVIATLVSTIIIDRLGRRILLLISISIMSLCHILLGIFFSLKQHVLNADEIKDIGFLPVLSLSIFIIVFSLGFGPIPWMISSEVFPREVKSTASSAAGTLNWFLAFIITMFFNDMNVAIGNDITFYMFAAICALGCVFVFFVVIETKGKTMNEIQRELGGESEIMSTQGVINEGFSA